MRVPYPLRGHARAIVDLVRESEPDAEERIKYGIPMWAVAGRDFCYLTFGPSRGKGVPPKVSLGFQEGTRLPDPDGRLVAITSAAKVARHVVVRADEDVPTDAVRALVSAAAALARRTTAP